MKGYCYIEHRRYNHLSFYLYIHTRNTNIVDKDDKDDKTTC